MKIIGINKDDMAALGCALFEYDQMGGFDYIYEQIGAKLGIYAVAGEGFDTTAFRVCSMIVEYKNPPTAADRITEMLYNVGISNANIIGAAREQRFNDVLVMLGQPGASRDYEMAGESVQTILKQHKQFDKRNDN